MTAIVEGHPLAFFSNTDVAPGKYVHASFLAITSQAVRVKLVISMSKRYPQTIGRPYLEMPLKMIETSNQSQSVSFFCSVDQSFPRQSTD